MSPKVEHTDVGAYALGLLEGNDHDAFTAHLAECPPCRAELAELSGMAEALTGIQPIDYRADDGPSEMIDLLHRQKSIERRRRWGTSVISAAAAVVLVGAGMVAGASIADGGTTVTSAHGGHGPAQELIISGERRTAADAASGVSGVVALESKGWGTHAALELRNVRGPLECELIAVSTSGEQRVVTGWAVPPSGYGVPGSPGPLYVHGGTPFKRTDIARFEVRVTGGKTLLAIPV